MGKKVGLPNNSDKFQEETLIDKFIQIKVKDPTFINWDNELKQVQKALHSSNPQQYKKAQYWGSGFGTKQWANITKKCIYRHQLSASEARKVNSNVQKGVLLSVFITWYLKYKWNIIRPNQLTKNKKTFLKNPGIPSYPSGHAAVAGTSATILSFYFPSEANKLKKLALECAKSRIYAGVHYPIDTSEGLNLGKQIGRKILKHI